MNKQYKVLVDWRVKEPTIEPEEVRRCRDKLISLLIHRDQLKDCLTGVHKSVKLDGNLLRCNLCKGVIGYVKDETLLSKEVVSSVLHQFEMLRKNYDKALAYGYFLDKESFPHEELGQKCPPLRDGAPPNKS